MKRIRHVRDLRQEILDVLSRAASPVQLLDLSKRLRIRSDSEEYDDLRTTLTAMAEEGLVSRHSRRRYSLATRDTTGLEGVLVMHHEHATVQTGDTDIPLIQIKRQHLLTALDGDRVRVQPLALRDGKKVRGEVVAVVERSSAPISGTIEYDGSFYYLVPDEAKHYVDFLVAQKNLNGARPGDKVIATFHRWEHANASPEAIVADVLGQSGQASVEFAAILKEFQLPASFPDVVEEEAAVAAPPGRNAPRTRTDIRKEVVITIDPDDARDFDDALSLRDLGNGVLELGVHIADVTHYVREGTALDAEARQRGNSTYLVDGVVPMLPEHLSNNICSLVPNEDRFAFSVFMAFTPNGVLQDYRIEETVIRSKRRFTYDEAQRVIDTGTGDHADLILALHGLARTLNASRMVGGGIDFETQEVKFHLDEKKMPVRAIVKSRTDATSLVEECMLAANRTVAEHLNTLKKMWKTKELPPYVYRVHDTPDPEKFGDAVSVIRALGIDVPQHRLGPTDINAILRAASNRADRAAINTLLLRSMAKAVYAEHNIGHYGLGFKEYAHFTSPIRRYPDLFVHRVLKEYAKGMPAKRRWSDLADQAAAVADQCSLTERASVDAERASVKLAQVILAREHIGETFDGVITGVTSFGVFVTMTELMIEGLLPMREITDDYYYFDERRYRLIGRRTRRVFAFGTHLRVRLAKADVEKRMIDVVLAEQIEARKPQPPRENNQREGARETVRPTAAAPVVPAAPIAPAAPAAPGSEAEATEERRGEGRGRRSRNRNRRRGRRRDDAAAMPAATEARPTTPPPAPEPVAAPVAAAGAADAPTESRRSRRGRRSRARREAARNARQAEQASASTTPTQSEQRPAPTAKTPQQPTAQPQPERQDRTGKQDRNRHNDRRNAGTKASSQPPTAKADAQAPQQPRTAQQQPAAKTPAVKVAAKQPKNAPQQPAAKAPAAKTPAAKTPVTKTSAVKAAKTSQQPKAAAKAPAAKTPVTKTPTKQAATKAAPQPKAATKAPAVKSSAAKTPAKKVATKAAPQPKPATKAPAVKTPVAKTPAKKTATKATPQPKSATKAATKAAVKTPVAKTPAKKTATKTSQQPKAATKAAVKSSAAKAPAKKAAKKATSQPKAATKAVTKATATKQTRRR